MLYYIPSGLPIGNAEGMKKDIQDKRGIKFSNNGSCFWQGQGDGVLVTSTIVDVLTENRVLFNCTTRLSSM